MRRLPLGPVDVSRVAIAAGTCEATVRRWIHGIDGHRCQDAAIAAALDQLDLHPVRLDPRAAATLPPVAQVELPVDIAVDGRVDNPPASPRDDAGNCGQKHTRIVARNGTVFLMPPECVPPGNLDPVASIAAPPPPETPAPRCTSKSRCHVTILNENDEVIQP